MADKTPVPEGAEELCYPLPESYVVPAEELNLRGVKEWSPVDRMQARTRGEVDQNVPPLAQRVAETPRAENHPVRIPYREDPRVGQVRREQEAAGAAAMAAQPVRSSPVEPSSGRPLSPAEYFRQETVPTILNGKETNNGRGY